MNLRHAWVVAMILRHACGRSEAGHSGAVGVLQPNLCDAVEQSKFWEGLGDLGTRRLLFYGRQLPVWWWHLSYGPHQPGLVVAPLLWSSPACVASGLARYFSSPLLGPDRYINI